MNMQKQIEPNFTPIIYPDLSIIDDKILLLGMPRAKITKSLAIILRLCTGENSVTELQAQVPEAELEDSLLRLRQLGYITFPQIFASKGDRESTKTLVISPHMDDAFLSIGGTLLAWHNLEKVHIIDVFGFDPGATQDVRSSTSVTTQNECRRKEELFNVFCPERIDTKWDLINWYF